MLTKQEILDSISEKLSLLEANNELITDAVLLVNTNKQATSFILADMLGKDFLWMINAAKFDLMRQIEENATPANFTLIPNKEK